MGREKVLKDGNVIHDGMRRVRSVMRSVISRRCVHFFVLQIRILSSLALSIRFVLINWLSRRFLV